MKQFVLYLVLLALSSCSPVLMKMYGIRNPEHLNTATIAKTAKQYGVPEKDLFVLDSSYLSFIFSQDSSKYIAQIKNHSQPLQALYFDKSKNFVSYYINCRAGGFPNLKWNRNGMLDTFLPHTQTPLDNIISFKQHLKFIRTLKNESVSTDTTNSDYYVIVYWNKFMGRQSKRLIQSIKENVKLSGKSKKMYYVNTDNAYIEKALKIK